MTALTSLRVSTERLSAVVGAREQNARSIKRVNGATGEVESTAIVSEEVLAATLTENPSCMCHELGLEAGMPASALIELGSGCTGETIDGRKVKRLNRGSGWVCERLIDVRKRYGR